MSARMVAAAGLARETGDSPFGLNQTDLRVLLCDIQSVSDRRIGLPGDGKSTKVRWTAIGRQKEGE